jgi:hypothetical protein
MNVGFDFGDTIFHGSPGDEKNIVHEGAIETIAKIVKEAQNAYIVSKATPEQAARAMKFCVDNDFFNKTKIESKNVRFCLTREEKAPIVKELGISFFVDDRPEVMHYLPVHIMKVMFKPIPEDVVKYYNRLKGTKIAQDWHEVYYWFAKELYD